MAPPGATDVVSYQGQTNGPFCWNCDYSLTEVDTGTCPQCGIKFNADEKRGVNWGDPLGPLRRLALTPFGWGMHVSTAVLILVVLMPPWIFGELGLFLGAWLLLVFVAVWLIRLLTFVTVGLASRYPRTLLFRPWKHTLIFPAALSLALIAGYVDLTLRVTVALHQAQLNAIAADVLAGKPIPRQTMWVYELDADEPISGCATLRIPQSDEILVFHPGGPPPHATYPFGHIWADWYEYLHY